MQVQGMRRIIVLVAVAAIVGVVAFQATAGRSEFGIGIPVGTSFSFTSFSFGLEAYYRWAGSMFAWETALHTNFGFSSLYIRDTLATARALYLCFGHVTNLLPYFGATYFTAGFGVALGNVYVLRASLSLAMSIGGGVYFFPELRFQFGIDP